MQLTRGSSDKECLVYNSVLCLSGIESSYGTDGKIVVLIHFYNSFLAEGRNTRKTAHYILAELGADTVDLAQMPEMKGVVLGGDPDGFRKNTSPEKGFLLRFRTSEGTIIKCSVT